MTPYYDGKCICCGDPSGYNWFCPGCVKVKEEAYRVSATLKEDFYDVIIRRDAALTKERKRKDAMRKLQGAGDGGTGRRSGMGNVSNLRRAWDRLIRGRKSTDVGDGDDAA